MAKQYKPLRILLICIGFVFFFNPYFATVDILPDFIGAILVLIGLIPFSRIDRHMQEASRAFFYFMIADLLKTIMLLFVFGMGHKGEQELLLLIIAFLSATIRIYFALKAVNAFFDGMDMLAGSEECEGLYLPWENRYSISERMRRFSVWFFIAREVILLLPEFSALLNSSYADSDVINLYEYIGVMRIFAFLPVLVVGIVWLVNILYYFAKIKDERRFLTSLGEKYAAYMERHPGIRVKFFYRATFILLAVGVLFLADFYIDYHNIISDIVGGAVLLIAVFLLCKKSLAKKWYVLLSSAAFLALSTASTRLSYLFSVNHWSGNIGKDQVVYEAYTKMWIFSLLEFLSFLAFLVLLLLLLREIIRNETGYIFEHEPPEFEVRNRKSVLEEFDWQLIKCFIFGFISGLCSFLFDYLKEWPEGKLFRFLELFWSVDLVAALLFAVYFGYTLTLIFGKIKERYRFE